MIYLSGLTMLRLTASDAELLCGIKCSACPNDAFTRSNSKGLRFICVGHLCKCKASGGSPICLSCYQRQKTLRLKFSGKPSWLICKTCSCYIQSSSKQFFFKGESIDLSYALLAQARFRLAFPQGFGSIQANGALNDFFETFKSLGGDETVYERFAIVISALFAQSSGPRFLPFPQEGFFSKRIHTKMRLLTMTRKLFFKLIGISCDIHMFKLGYSVQKFSYVHNNYRFFLKLILKRILARFYLLP